MATFRSGFKIFGELTLRRTLGRIRSYSEDRKPGSWLPEDQWAVRPPCTTCPDPCTPKKPKSSKSWLSICRDPEPPLPCDIRHNNCPPPKTDDEPWYSFITKKKTEKPKPPLSACRAELQKQAEMPDEEETCENLGDTGWPEYSPPCPPCPPEEPDCKELQPAPVIRLSCPPPKELDLMLWCGRPGLSVSRIASQCQSDRMPYEEFRPRKCWKPPPYSLPCKSEAPAHQPFCCNVGRAPLAEYKQVEIPKPVYTRYKSVELEDENFLLCMTDARCPPDNCGPSLALEPPPIKTAKPPPVEPKPEPCPEKPVLVAASRKPVKLRCAPKFKFRPKPTKLIEKRHFRNPCAQHKACDLTKIKPPEEEKPCEPNWTPPCSGNPPKVITSNITDEPQTYQRNTPSKKPPLWMFVLSKPGSNDTPLVPYLSRYPKEPDWCGETDGLKFYDGQNEGLCPKPPPDPCEECPEQPTAPPPCPPKPQPKIVTPPAEDETFVLMPDKYNIRNMRPPDVNAKKDLSQATFQQFIEAKTANIKKCSKLYPQMKESILYDFVRNCPLPPLDPSKPDPPPRKPPEPECPQPIRFYYRRYSTFSPFQKPNYAKYFNRMKSEDSREKCKARKLVPKPKDCGPPVKGPSCDKMTLPCCPKAKVPPRCDVKRQVRPCKKRLAPQPSYSECSKDPPPCPRITECNAWEKRDVENQKKGPSKGRRFSSWAPEEGHVRDSQNTKAESTEESLDAKHSLTSQVRVPSYLELVRLNPEGKYLNKNKRTPYTQPKIFSGKELMLNFVNQTEDSYYTSESLVKGRKQQKWKKLTSVQPEEKKSERSVGTQLHERKVISLLLQDHHTRNDARAKNLRISHRESGLGVYIDGTSPRNVLASIGNWISGLLKAQGKRSHSAPPALVGANQSRSKSYVETVDVDRIMKLTKPFRHGTKSKDDKVSYYTVDPLGGIHLRRKLPLRLRRFWGRQRDKSLILFPKLSKERAHSSMWKFEALSPTVQVKTEREKTTGWNQTNDVKLLQAPAEKGREKPSRLPVRKPEEYSMPVVENLGGGALLVNRNREKHNTRMDQLLGKSGSRSYTAPVTDFQREASMRPRQIETNAGRKTKCVKTEVASRPKTEAVKFMQSATSALVASVLAKKKSQPRKVSYAKKRPSDKAIVPINLPQKPWLYLGTSCDCDVKMGFRKTISSTTFARSKPKKWLEHVAYYPEWKKGWNKSNGTLAKDDLKYRIDKYLKRKEVRNALSKLDLKKSFPRLPTDMQHKEKDYCSHKFDNGGRSRGQHANFRDSRKQADTIELDADPAEPVGSLANAARVFNTSLSTGDLSRELSNHLELYEADLDVTKSADAKPVKVGRDKQRAESQEQEKRANKPVATTSYEKWTFAALSLYKKEARPIAAAIARQDMNSSKSYQAVVHTRRYAKASENPAGKADKKTGCNDSDVDDKIRKEKPERGSRSNAKNGKKKDEVQSTCRTLSNKKPGPNCPDGFEWLCYDEGPVM